MSLDKTKGIVYCTGMKKRIGIESQLRQAIKESGMSRNQLALKSGVDPAQLSYFVNGKRSLTLTSAEKIAEVLELELKAKKKKRISVGFALGRKTTKVVIGKKKAK